MNTVVLECIGQLIRIRQVIHRDHIEITLHFSDAGYGSSYPTKTIDGNLG